MSNKRSRPVIGKLLISSNRTGFQDTIMSPKSPLHFKIRSPRGIKNYDDLGAVGLGIVVALEKKIAGEESQIQPKFVVGSLNMNNSDPIPIGSSKIREILEMCETSHEHNEYAISRLYCDGSGVHDRNSFHRKYREKLCFFCESPPRFSEITPAFPMMDFLSSCYLCRKKLHGKDIFMYRGEKAFCSTGCRYRQIVLDERKEKCRAETSRATDGSSSPYVSGQLFSTGIIAA